MAVDYNDRVTVGQALAVLDTTKLRAKVLQSKVLSAQATVDEARNQVDRLNRFREISGNKAVSQIDLDAAVASLQAPVLFILAEDLARMELIVDVDEADVGAVSAGQTAEFTVDAYSDRRFQPMSPKSAMEPKPLMALLPMPLYSMWTIRI